MSCFCHFIFAIVPQCKRIINKCKETFENNQTFEFQISNGEASQPVLFSQGKYTPRINYVKAAGSTYFPEGLLISVKKSTGEYLNPGKKVHRSTFFRGVLIDGYSGPDKTPQDYHQKRKLFRTNSFVLAHSSAKKIYNEQLTLKSTIQWYHLTECDVI